MIIIKKTKILLITILSLILISSGIYLFLLNQISNVAIFKKQAEAEFVGTYAKIGNYSDLDEYKKQEAEIYLTNKDIIKPVYSMILNTGYRATVPKDKYNDTEFRIIVFYFERTGIDKFKILDYKAQTVYNTSLTEVRAFVQKKDVSKLEYMNNSNQFFARGTPLTSQEILEAKRKADAFAPKTQLQIYQENCVKWFEYEVFMRQAILDKKSSVTYPDGLTVPVSIDLDQLDFLVTGKKEICNKLKSELQIP